MAKKKKRKLTHNEKYATSETLEGINKMEMSLFIYAMLLSLIPFCLILYLYFFG